MSGHIEISKMSMTPELNAKERKKPSLSQLPGWHTPSQAFVSIIVVFYVQTMTQTNPSTFSALPNKSGVENKSNKPGIIKLKSTNSGPTLDTGGEFSHCPLS